MKEFIDKLIRELEELKQTQIQELCEHKNHVSEMQSMRGFNVLQDVIKIVKELAEEYKVLEKFEQLNDGWHPYSETKLPPAGYVRDVWLTLEDGVFKAVWMRDHFEWENEFLVTETPIAWKFCNIPEAYQQKGEKT